MSISFPEIYTKAISLFDDPKVTVAYETNRIQFYKIMYSYFQNAIAQFNNPAYIGYMLSENIPPNGQLEIFEADGMNNIFTLDPSFEFIDNSSLLFMENGVIVEGSLDIENRTVTFPHILDIGDEYSFEQYFAGEFTNSFDNIVSNPNARAGILGQVKDVLARLLVLAWSEDTKNFLLDIKNIMTDSDFKLSSNSRILSSKIIWYENMKEEIKSAQNKLAWAVRFNKKSDWQSR